MAPAARSDIAAIVRGGFPVATVGNTPLPTRYRLGWSHDRRFLSTTDVVLSLPMRYVPTMWPAPKKLKYSVVAPAVPAGTTLSGTFFTGSPTYVTSKTDPSRLGFVGW